MWLLGRREGRLIRLLRGLRREGGEGGKDIFNIVSFDAVKKEIRGVEFSHKVEAFCWVPFMNGRFETSDLGKEKAK